MSMPQPGNIYLAGDDLKEVTHVGPTTFNVTNIVYIPNNHGWVYYSDYTLYFQVPDHWRLVSQGKPMDHKRTTLLVKEYLV